MRTIHDLMREAGGAKVIAEKSRKTKFPVRKRAVFLWAQSGIPARHWPLMISLVDGLTADELLRANMAAKGVRMRPLRAEARVA